MNEKIEPHKTTFDVDNQGLKDFVFESIVRMCNLSEAQVNMTIVISGLVVSGTLIGIREYYDEVLKLGPESAFYKSIHSLKDSVNQERLEKERVEGKSPNYFHLKNAMFFSVPTSPFPTNGILWRGKVSEVNGFSFGTLQLNN